MAVKSRTEKRKARRRGDHPTRRILPPDRTRAANPLDRITLNGRLMRMQVGDRLLDASLERTIEGPETVTLNLWDGDRAVSRSGVFGDRTLARMSYIALDGLYFQISGLERQGDQLTAIFEDWVVAELKRHGKDRPVRVARGVMTRAQFCAFLLRQAGAKVVVLDESVVQPIQGAKNLREEIRKARRESTKGTTRNGPLAGVNKVFPKHSLGQAQANPDGWAWLSTRQVRAIGEAIGFTPTQALHMAQVAHGESGLQIGGEWRHYPGIVASDQGIGLAQITPWAAFPNKTGAAYELYVKSGRDAGMRNPVSNLKVARQMFQDRSGTFGAWYGTSNLNLASRASGPILKPGQAEAILGEAREGGVPTEAYTKDYYFDRRRGESTWACCKRLLDEVRWRMFVREGVIVIASDPALMRGAPSLIVKEGSEPLEGKLNFRWHKALRVAEMDGRMYVRRWQADPGETVDVDGMPAIDRRWLIASTRVSLARGDRLGDLSFRAPQQPLKEPAPEVAEQPTAESSNGDPAPKGSVGERPGVWIWPTEVQTITSDFGPRTAPIPGASTYHDGLDIGAPSGANVRAVDGGTVKMAGPNGGYGNYVSIDHGEGGLTFYAHMAAVLVRGGQRVAKGAIVGRVGSTGNSSGPHLHFGYHVNGQPRDPMSRLP